MTPDIEIAKQFLEILAPDGNITFQTFGEGESKGDKKLCRVLHGTLEEHWPELTRLSQSGASIFIMVNQGDGNGRSAQHIISIRAIFIDLDKDGPAKLAVIEALPEGARPNIIIETSPGRFHVYWLINGHLPLEDFKPVQQKFNSRFGGDPSICDRPRVMRLPGFYHRKDVPHLVRMVAFRKSAGLPVKILLKNKAVTLEQPRTTEPLSGRIDTAKGAVQINSDFLPSAPPPANIKRHLSQLAAIPSDDYDDYIKVCMGTKHEFGEAGREIFHNWAATSEKYDRDENDAKWDSFESDHSCPVTGGTISHLAKKYGWTGEKTENLTDKGNGERLVRCYGAIIRYVIELKSWLLWEGSRWHYDNVEIHRLAKATTDKTMEEARSLPDDQRQRLIKHALASENISRLTAMIELAKSEADIAINQWRLDRDPFLLNVQNGTLDLKKGILKPFDPADYLTRRLEIQWSHEKSPCPNWLNFIDRILSGKTALIRFIQKAFGYSLTGSTKEQCLFFLYGTGANGKSTLLNVLKQLLNDYAMQTGSEALMVKPNPGGANPELARLRGARVVITSEVEDGQRLAESTIKQLTGQDAITVRHLYCPPFEFQPEFKLWIAGNHRPVIRGTDPAIWRRINLIPFTVTVPAEEQDKDLGDKLKKEMPGILQWAIEGCRLWQKEGLQPPAEVKAATDDYRGEMDTIGQWMKDCCTLSPDQKTTAQVLYNSYKSWCVQNGNHPLAQKRLGMALKERDLQSLRTPHAVWQGIGLSNLSTPAKPFKAFEAFP